MTMTRSTTAATTTTANTTEDGTLDPTVRSRPVGYIDAIVTEGERFARAAAMGDLETPIAACPGWTMRDLVHHLGEIHLWAAANVAFPKPSWLHVGDLTDLARHWPGLAGRRRGDDELVAWYRATHANLVHVLRTAQVDVEAFVFLPAASPLTMWARRQASEIAIHRFDAEAARGVASHFEAGFATDMVGELLEGFAPTRQRSVAVADRALRVIAGDVEEQWWVTMGPAGVATSRRGDRADLVVTGTAAELYLLLWNRTPDSTVHLDGDVDVMDLWRETCRVQWRG